MKTIKHLLFTLVLCFAVQAQASFSVSKSLVGFEVNTYLTPPRVVPMIGAPSEAFTKGEPLVLNTLGYVTAAANGSANIIGVAYETKTMTASTSVTGHELLVETNLDGIIWQANLDASGWLEDAAASAVNAAGTIIAFGTGLTAGGAGSDDTYNGHVLVCYRGPCASEWRYIIDYDAADGGTGEQSVYVDHPFTSTVTTSCYFIILGTGTTLQGIVEGGHIDLGSTSAVKVKGTDYAGALRVVSLRDAWKGVIIFKITDNVDQAP